MIAYVKGPIAFKSLTYVIIDVNGVGYRVHISINTYEKIAALDDCRLLTHMVIREDAHQLYGFFDEEERDLFRHLIGITGVGPNTARMMLSSLSPEELKRAIITGDISLIKSVKGIGPKGAQRIVIELQDVLKKTSAIDMTTMVDKSRAVDEALAAMAMLGFQRAQAEKAVSTVVRNHGGNMTVEEILKQALKLI
jgi:Holliday junction DNA helicase RuvA